MSISYYNQSLLNMAPKCMKQVEFRYIRGIIIPPGVAAHRGIAVHKAAEADARTIIEGKERLGIADLQDVAADQFHQSIERGGIYLSDEEAPNAKTLLANAKDEAVKAAKLYGEEVSPRIGMPAFIEAELTLEIKDLSLPLGGTIDLLHVARDNAHEIIDLKTTAKQPSMDVRTHSIQAPLYSMLAEKVLGHAPNFTYDYLVVQKTKQTHVQIEAEVTAQSRANVVERAQIVERLMNAGIFMPAAPGSWWCAESWCGYWGICSHGGKQQVQVSTI